MSSASPSQRPYVPLNDPKESDRTFTIEDDEERLNPPTPVPGEEPDESINSLIDEGTGFTFRAVFVGTLLGCIIGASNMYLGLTVGWSFGGSLFGSIVGFAVLKPLSRILPERFGGGFFGPKENCTVQSAAGAAGGLSVGFISAIPALYRLKLMSAKVTDDALALIMWSLAAAYFGLFFAIPLRRYFILKQKLIFPSPTVSAETIRSLHRSASGEMAGRSKAKILLIAFVAAFLVKLLTWWVPVILEWHILFHLGNVTKSHALVVADLVWKWRIELAGAFVGAGMLVGVQTSSSFFAGSVTAWGIAGPALLATGVVAGAYGFPSNLNPSKPLSEEDFKSQVTAQYWLLWPGVTMMIASSFTDLFIRWRSLARGIYGGFAEAYEAFASLRRTPAPVPISDSTDTLTTEEGKSFMKTGSIKSKHLDDGEEEDPAPPEFRVPVLWWGPGLLLSVIFTVVVLSTFFKVGPGESLLAILLGFLLAFVGIQASGETDINPTGSIGKTSQFVFALAFQNREVSSMLRTNLIAGNVAAACASQTVDMVGDLKTAHLLRASPRTQFLAQAIGSFVAVFLSVGLFTIFGTAYPCFLNPTVTTTLSTRSHHSSHNIPSWDSSSKVHDWSPEAFASNPWGFDELDTEQMDVVGLEAEAVGSEDAGSSKKPNKGRQHLNGKKGSGRPSSKSQNLQSSSSSSPQQQPQQPQQQQQQQCPFEAPAVASWTAVSLALTSGISKTVPNSSAYTSLVILLLTILYTILKHRLVSKDPRWIHYLPNANAIGIAFVNPQPHIGFAMMVGGLVSGIWKAKGRKSWEVYCYAVASGLIAGEGIGGIVEAVYALVGWQRSKNAWNWGIPDARDRDLARSWSRHG
ncbi:hypothetical protein HDU97_002031 [Phlyctochytrium planicorne]|nr:hypothetical protein HDU97_002031 [Phlyctochytrium planicorne]